MRRPSRTRRVLKWVGVGMCVLTLIACVLSCWCDVYYAGKAPAIAVAMETGTLGIVYQKEHPPLRPFGLYVAWREFQLPHVAPFFDFSVRYRKLSLFVPFWLLLLLVCAPTAFLWWRDRHFPAGYCQNCGYNLTGNVSGRCPECGTAVGQEGNTG